MQAADSQVTSKARVSHAMFVTCKKVTQYGVRKETTIMKSVVQMVGHKKCPISDTYWQTETGAHLISNLPGAWPQKPGSASLPFFGIDPVIVNEKVRCGA